MVSVNSQKTHGTTIICAVGTDGIIMASDSRLMNLPQGNYEWYRDSAQKIFNILGRPVAFSGAYTIGEKKLWQIVEEINSYYRDIKEFHSFFQFIISYFIGVHPPKDTLENKTTAYSVGYIGDSAYIYDYTFGASRAFDNTIFRTNGIIVDSMFKVKYKMTDCITLAKLAEETIRKYSKIRFATGGPISIIILGKNNNWYFKQNDFSARPEGESRPHLHTIHK